MKSRNAPIVAPNWKNGSSGRVGLAARRQAVAEAHDQRDGDGGGGDQVAAATCGVL